jgi:hypothetical protein
VQGTGRRVGDTRRSACWAGYFVDAVGGGGHSAVYRPNG